MPPGMSDVREVCSATPLFCPRYETEQLRGGECGKTKAGPLSE